MDNFTVNMVVVYGIFAFGTLAFGIALGPILRRLNKLRDKLDAQASHHS
ncbi:MULTISPECIES: hypothetical protein [Acetobacter]|uniref:Heme exporter protein D n=2 Tax=Acetobacter pasteurianus TaxID=438 RepID=A0A401WYH4_ACEPA|nr:hypothetical protein [Acetobacter pasteurianus]ARW49343.1 hypothetical protein S1001342_03053 [Acetobacter pasteurianus subsp. pasteurianus]GCD54366.1 hypothetical protein NBRC3188_3063 [Acetobacter pasteurianus NBRC 3188]